MRLLSSFSPLSGSVERMETVSYTHLDVYKRQDGYSRRNPG